MPKTEDEQTDDGKTECKNETSVKELSWSLRQTIHICIVKIKKIGVSRSVLRIKNFAGILLLSLRSNK